MFIIWDINEMLKTHLNPNSLLNLVISSILLILLCITSNYSKLKSKVVYPFSVFYDHPYLTKLYVQNKVLKFCI